MVNYSANGATTPKYVLFVISGLGLGNSTRCDALIDELHRQHYRIDVLASANAFEYFAGDHRIERLHRLASLDYAGGKQGIDILQTLITLPRLVAVYAQNVRRLSEVLAAADYDGLVIDSDYSIAPLRRRFRLPVIALNNSDALASDARNFFRLPRSARAHFLVEMLDYAFHRAVPDLVLSPAVSEPVKSCPGIRHVPPLVRRAKIAARFRPRARAGKKLRIVIIPGGSRFSGAFSDVERLKRWTDVEIEVWGVDGVSARNVRYRPFTKAIDPILEADILVINAGFSSVSEAIVYRKPVVVVPVQNHAEQFQNARTLECLGLGLVATEANWVEKLRAVRRYLPDFRDAHARFASRGDGARAAAAHVATLLATRQPKKMPDRPTVASPVRQVKRSHFQADSHRRANVKNSGKPAERRLDV